MNRKPKAKLAAVPKKKIDPAIARIRGERGLAVRIADALGIKRAAVYQWRRVPEDRVMTVAPLIDMPPKNIRPDLFRKAEALLSKL